MPPLTENFVEAALHMALEALAWTRLLLHRVVANGSVAAVAVAAETGVGAAVAAVAVVVVAASVAVAAAGELSRECWACGAPKLTGVVAAVAVVQRSRPRSASRCGHVAAELVPGW